MDTFHFAFNNNNGRRNHYYHFFYGVFLPLCEYFANLRIDVPFTLLMASCGEMNGHLNSHPMIPAGCRLELIPSRKMLPDSLCIPGIDDAPNAMKRFFFAN